MRRRCQHVRRLHRTSATQSIHGSPCQPMGRRGASATKAANIAKADVAIAASSLIAPEAAHLAVATRAAFAMQLLAQVSAQQVTASERRTKVADPPMRRALPDIGSKRSRRAVKGCHPLLGVFKHRNMGLSCEGGRSACSVWLMCPRWPRAQLASARDIAAQRPHDAHPSSSVQYEPCAQQCSKACMRRRGNSRDAMSMKRVCAHSCRRAGKPPECHVVLANSLLLATGTPCYLCRAASAPDRQLQTCAGCKVAC